MQKDRSHRGESKVDNLHELAHATRHYTPQNTALPPLVDFLANISLDQGDLNENNTQSSVQLMTLHASKGLEFSTVFLVGLEEGLFPHQMCLQDPKQLEEERRLCYVGITRAMRSLHLSQAECRRLHGQETFQRPSRFISEIPDNLLDVVRMSHQTPTLSNSSSAFNQHPHHLPQSVELNRPYPLGSQIQHTYFGNGTVLNYEGQDAHTRIQVAFDQVGIKWLMLNQAPIQCASR